MWTFLEMTIYDFIAMMSPFLLILKVWSISTVLPWTGGNKGSTKGLNLSISRKKIAAVAGKVSESNIFQPEALNWQVSPISFFAPLLFFVRIF